MSADKPGAGRDRDAQRLRGLDGKRDYVAGLEARRDEQAVSLLVECLCDESSYLRDLSEKAIVRLGPAHAPALRPLLAHGLWYTRAVVARILGIFGDREALDDLATLAADANGTAAEAAADALARIAKEGDAPNVAQALALAPEGVRKAVVARAEAVAPGLGAEIARLVAERPAAAAGKDKSARHETRRPDAPEPFDWGLLASPPHRPRRTSDEPPKETPPETPPELP